MTKYNFVFTIAIFVLLPIKAQNSQLLATADSLSNKGSEVGYMGNYNDAICIETEALGIRAKVLGKEHPDYAVSLNNLASYNAYLGNYSEAIALGTEALGICERVFGKEHPNYATLLNNLALYNSNIGNYNDAINLETEALGIYEKVFGKEHPDYATLLNNLASYNSHLGNYSEAINLETEVLGIRAKIIGKEHPDYAVSLSNLASYNAYLGNYSEAMNLETEALDIRAEVLGSKHPDYAISLRNLASCNASLGNYSEAMNLETEALGIYEKVFGKEHPDYAILLSNLASYKSSLGNYSEAINLATEALDIRAKVLGREHPDYAVSLSNLASYNGYLGNYSEAINLETEALGIRARVLGREHPDYAVSLINLANYNSFFGNYSDAINLATEALGIRAKVLGREHPDYASSLNSLASYKSSLGNYSEAINLATEVLDILAKAISKEHPDYAISLNNLASYNAYLGNYSEAIALGTEALGICTKVLGREHPDYAILLNNLATHYHNINNLDSLAKYTNECTNLKSRLIHKTFIDLTSNEQSLFWKIHENWFAKLILQFANKFPTDSLITNAYNGTLLSKGLLLNSEIEMNKLLLESGDKEIVEAYNELRTNRQMLNKLYEKPIAERYMNTDSLERVVNQMERDLVQRSKIYGDYTRNLAIEWQDVQKRLGKKDVAVEFVSFPHTQDSTMYAAFVLKSDMTTPQMVSLFEAKQLSAIPSSKYYTTSDVSNLVWGKLSNYLDGVDNVYFAPAGELYNIAIESLPNIDGEGLMSDKHNFYRLSSTRELAVTKDKNATKEAALYGGLKYDTDTKQMVEDSERYQRATRNFELFNIADSLNLRNGAAYLPATKVEAEDINQSLKKTPIHSSLFTENIGTEASFKDLSGKKINLLHIATHGFYWTESEVKMKDHLNFLQLGTDKTPRYVEDKAMTRSGLLLAGANNALMGKPLPENVEDGILTAKEIATLDLRGLDLVVLSACQTGLGEITGDGVFGLQRGFKKAGANTLMMSLWKVDDNATQMLMSKFYEYLIAGKSKYESLREAQRYVREYEEEVEVKDDEKKSYNANQKEQTQRQQTEKVYKKSKPYQDPKYWVAFILLDGIN